MPVRVYDIAKKFGLDNKEVLAIAKEFGVADAKESSSSLDPVQAEKLEKLTRMRLDEQLARGLRGFQLGHFKAFADLQSVPIRPLTLIFGANSSGKSSIIHGLLLARHALDTGELDVSRTEIGGDSVDLGGFGQYVHRRDVSQRVELAVELQTNVLRGNAANLLNQGKTVKITLTMGMPLDNLGKPERGAKARLMAYDVECGERSMLRLSLRPDRTMQLDRLDNKMLQTLIEAIMVLFTTVKDLKSGKEREIISTVVQSMIPALRFTCHRLLPNQLAGEDFASGQNQQLVPIGRANRQEELENSARLFVPRAIADLIRNINQALQSQLEMLAYLGPMRSIPPRHLAFNDDRDRNWLAGGGYAWDLVRTNWGVRRLVNEWLGSKALSTPYKLAVERLISSSDAEAALEQGLDSVAADLERKRREALQAGTETDNEMAFPYDSLGSPEQAKQLLEAIQQRTEQNPLEELVLMDCRTNTPVSHRDVGIGVSQVLPVLVHADADRGRTILIEQPEIHLHPALQSELGDLFILSALGPQKNTFLLETHSEHLILRILRRVRETTEDRLPKDMDPIKPEDISVVYVEPTAKGSVVKVLTVTPDGDFAEPWPGGFFAERLEDLP